VQKLLQNDRKKLGQNVVALREATKLTQEQLAEKAGIDRRFIQKIEAGQLGASLAVLKRLRKPLRASWDDLLAEI
jgi:transcriptional regulator with XRE-family HTH domain